MDSFDYKRRAKSESNSDDDRPGLSGCPKRSPVRFENGECSSDNWQRSEKDSPNKGTCKRPQCAEPLKMTSKRSPAADWSEVERNILFNAVTTVGKPILNEYAPAWERRNAWRAIYRAVNASGFVKTPHQIKVAWAHMKEAALDSFKNQWKNKPVEACDLDGSVFAVLRSDEEDFKDSELPSSPEELTEAWCSKVKEGGSRSRRLSSTADIIKKLEEIAKTRPEKENEFGVFGRHVAEQLNKLPLERAMICQEKIQSILTQERLTLLMYKGSSRHSLTSSPVSDTSDAFSDVSPLADNENSSGDGQE